MFEDVISRFCFVIVIYMTEKGLIMNNNEGFLQSLIGYDFGANVILLLVGTLMSQ